MRNDNVERTLGANYGNLAPMNLREQVENLLPEWQSWYPTVFEAAVDLGLLRARVCPPGSLLLSQRHASVYNEAVQAFREQWSVAEPEGDERERETQDSAEDSTQSSGHRVHSEFDTFETDSSHFPHRSR